MKLLEMFKESLPSVIQDPFKKTKVKSISVYYRESFWSSDKGKWEASGNVEFSNGNTSGKQEFKGETFDEVVMKIKAMLETLE